MMISHNLLGILRQHLVGTNAEIVEQNIWTLCNMISEVAEYKITLWELGIYDRVLSAFSDYDYVPSIRRVFAWFISNTIRTPPYLETDIVS